MMPAGFSSNTSRTIFAICASETLPVPKVSTRTDTGLRDADRVRELHLAARRQLGGDDVLRDVARHVGGAAVDLARVLAAERAAAVAAVAAVGVDDDLPAGEAAVALRAALDEACPSG